MLGIHVGGTVASVIVSTLGVSDNIARILGRTIWIARVPVVSIAAALLIFSQAEALDLFVDIPPDKLHRVLHWVGFYVAAVLFWVLPVHFSARVALQLNHERTGVDTPRRYLAFVVAPPRILSVLCLLVIAYAFLRAWNHVPSVGRGTLAGEARQHLLWASYWAVGLSVACMLVFAWLSRLSVLERSKLRPIAPALYDRLDSVVGWCKPRRRYTTRPVFEEERLAAAQHNTLISVFLLLTIVFALDIALCVLFLWRPVAQYLPALESYLPRAVFVPVLLGFYIPGLALLGILSHRFRLPLIVAFLLALGIWGLFQERRHDVRLPPVSSGPVQRIALEEAIDRWKDANGCTQGKCPRPIIVAGSGGASRAAFMTANTLAALQERYPSFRQRLFAMSTVSGSSLGAAAFLAGLSWKDDRPDPDRCRDRRFQLWFGCHDIGDEALDDPSKTTLQRRVQLFLAHDFLTPVAVAFTFSDMWRIGENRAVKLEKSWESAWRHVTSDPVPGGDFSKRFSLFTPKDEWRPLLIFNGTSVSSGRRIVVSPLLPTHKDRRLFVDAFDYYEMACAGQASQATDCDLRLSTAITMSARFPLVSPPGNIVRNGVPVDRVVDGGYFENFGAQSALELARALQSLNPPLKPFILQITNDPSAFDYNECSGQIDWEHYYHFRRPEPPSEFDTANLFRWAFDPLNTVLETRTARGTQATAEALATVTAGSYAQIRVCPELIDSGSQGALTTAGQTLGHLLQRVGLIRPYVKEDGRGADAFKSLSASWWLSAPVQQYLHKQLEAPHNRKEIERIGNVLEGPGS